MSPLDVLHRAQERENVAVRLSLTASPGNTDGHLAIEKLVDLTLDGLRVDDAHIDVDGTHAYLVLMRRPDDLLPVGDVGRLAEELLKRAMLNFAGALSHIDRLELAVTR